MKIYRKDLSTLLGWVKFFHRLPLLSPSNRGTYARFCFGMSRYFPLALAWFLRGLDRHPSCAIFFKMNDTAWVSFARE